VAPALNGLYIADENYDLRKFESDTVYRLGYTWRSKTICQPKPTTFGMLQVLADWTTQPALTQIALDQAAERAANAVLWINGGYAAGWNDVEVNQYELNGSAMAGAVWDDLPFVVVDVYMDEVLAHSLPIVSDKPVRLHGETRASRISVAVRGNIPVRRVAMVKDALELAQL
jgi:hypothetical protein